MEKHFLLKEVNQNLNNIKSIKKRVLEYKNSPYLSDKQIKDIISDLDKLESILSFAVNTVKDISVFEKDILAYSKYLKRLNHFFLVSTTSID